VKKVINHNLKKTSALLIIILSAITVYGQTENPRTKNRNGISLYAMGPNVVGSFSYDYFLTSNLNAEAGIGFIGIHGGLKVHLWGGKADKSWTPYFGAAITRSLFPSVGVDYLPYFPIGIHFAGKNRLNFSFEVAPLQFKLLAWNVAGVKIGYRFR
jgi:hypothetical protein